MPVTTEVKSSFTERINRIEISATLAVVNEADKLRSEGADLVDFGAGEPHFATPQHIKDAAIEAIQSNFTRYTVVSGVPEPNVAPTRPPVYWTRIPDAPGCARVTSHVFW